MTKHVLFSPIGASDPVRGEHDGPMLHIVRHYLPHKVYLYYTKEMIKKSQEVIKALQKFDLEIEEIFTDIDNPHDFDVFTYEFEQRLVKVQLENIDSQILLNVSSGTTQLTSALCLEVITSSLQLKPIQVVSPTGKSNVGLEFGGDPCNNFDELMDGDGYIAPNRCLEPHILSFKRSSLKREITSLITHYEYRAAHERLKDNSHLFNEEAMHLAKYAKLRQNDEAEFVKHQCHRFFNFTQDANAAKACDYYCLLNNKAETNELSYFVILLRSVAEFIAKDYMGNIDHDLASSNLNAYYQSRRPFSSYSRRYHAGGISYNLEQYTVLMEYRGKPADIIEKFWELVKLTDSRNELAHDLVTEASVNTTQALRLLKAIIVATYGNRVKAESFDLYQIINQKICAKL